MEQVSTFTLNVGQVKDKNSGKICAKPSITVVDGGGFSLSCPPELVAGSVYTLEGYFTDSNTDKCVTILISCSDGDCPTGDCGVTEKTICLCSDDTECGDCEVCDGNLCVTICQDDEFCANDRCVQCDPDNPCPDGKVCKNGRCVCPQDRPLNIGGRCFECAFEGVQNCAECRDGELVPLPCTGVCDPGTNQCVDCLQASDCDGDNECCSDSNDCECCEGYQRDSLNRCQPIPECTKDSDCGDCEVCNDGGCDPVVCPFGSVCVPGYGCVPECDCNTLQGCNDITNRCAEGPLGCGCVPCDGDCGTGCGTGCYCAGDECVGDPCFSGNCPCQDGTDCPEGFGCDGTNCVPCGTLSCSNTQCRDVLGCTCTAEGCVDSDNPCNDAPCVTSEDCEFGCTCDEGLCKSCSNFSCAECGTIAGCNCTGVECLGEDSDCTDTFILSKSDSSCSLTATLTKQESCACDPITVAVLGKRRDIGDSQETGITFKAQLHKGVFQGDLSLPLLDDVLDSSILENDSPTSGRVSVTARVSFIEYSINPTTGVRTRIGTGQQSPVTADVNFITGTTAQLELPELVVPNIDSVQVTETNGQGEPIKEIKISRITFTAEVTDDFGFPNGCVHRDTPQIGAYQITRNSDIEAFGLGFTNPKAVTSTTPDTRDPAFRWYKSDAQGGITGDPFRKLYVPGTGSQFVDTISKPEGLEGCKWYKVISDCTCTTSPDIYGTFCNPEDLKFTVSNCGKRITIDPEELVPCDVNQDVSFYFRAGAVYQTWLGSRGDIIAGQTYDSVTKITEVEFGIVCDTESECTKTYPVDDAFSALDIDLTYTCSGDNTQAEVVIPSFDASLTCGIDRVEFEGEAGFLVPGQTFTTSAPTFTYTVYWICGCDPTTKTVVVECCDTTQQALVRNCDGSVECQHLAGYTYTIDGQVITDICADALNYINRPLSSSYQIVRTKDNCPSQTISVAGINCCDDFDLVRVPSSNLDPIFKVLGGAGEVPTVSPTANGEFMQLSGTGEHEYRIVNYVSSQSYALTLVSSEDCGVVTLSVLGVSNDSGPGSPGGDPEESDPSPDAPTDTTVAMGVESNSDFATAQVIDPDCGNATTLSRLADGTDYTLRATTADTDCGCPSEVAEFRITSAVDNLDGTMDVELFTDISTVVPVEASNFQIEDIVRGTLYGITPDDITTLALPKSVVTSIDTAVASFATNIEVSGGTVRFFATRLSGITNSPPNTTPAEFFTLEDITQTTFGIEGNVLVGTSSTSTVGSSDYLKFTGPGDQTSGGVTLALTATQREAQIVPVTITCTNSSATTFIATVNIFITVNGLGGVSVNFDSSVQFEITTEKEVDTQLRLRVNSLAKANGCTYAGNTGVIGFTTDTSFVFPSNSREVNLALSSSNSRTKFDWKDSGGTVILEEFNQTQSTLTTGLVTLGDAYSVTTECGTCTQTQTLRVCPPISGNVTVDTCLENASFSLSGDTQVRAYDVTFEGVTQVVNMVGGTGSTSFAQVMTESTDYTVSVVLQGTASCATTFSFTTGLKDVSCP